MHSPTKIILDLITFNGRVSLERLLYCMQVIATESCDMAAEYWLIVCVCGCVCLYASFHNHTSKLNQIFCGMFPMAVAWSFSVGVAIRYVFMATQYFTTRRYANAVHDVVMCLSVCLSVSPSTPVLSQIG